MSTLTRTRTITEKISLFNNRQAQREQIEQHPFPVYSLEHVASTLEHVFEGQKLHRLEFKAFHDHNRRSFNNHVKKFFPAGTRYTTEKVLRKIHAAAVRRALELGLEITLPVLAFHQFTPELLEGIKEYAKSKNINLEY